MSRAFVVVDVQRDFCPGGSLATERGAEVARAIATYLADHAENYDAVVATRDWHIDPGSHFSSSPNYVDTWPVHCVANSTGAQFHPELFSTQWSSPRQAGQTNASSFPEAAPEAALQRFDAIFSKGAYDAAYSGFEGSTEEGTSLGAWLNEQGIDTIDVVGIATDHCVWATVRDGLQEGLQVRLLANLCAPVSPERAEEAIASMEAHGSIIASA